MVVEGRGRDELCVDDLVRLEGEHIQREVGADEINMQAPFAKVAIQKEFIALRDECGLDYKFPFEK